MAVRLRSQVELGVVLGDDPDPPGLELQALLPVDCPFAPRWGQLLVVLSAAFACFPSEMAGPLLFAAPRSALKLAVTLADGSAVTADAARQAALLVGVYPFKAGSKLREPETWKELLRLQQLAVIVLTLHIAGDPARQRARASWRRRYTLDADAAGLTGLPQGQGLPGFYLEGFDRPALLGAQIASGTHVPPELTTEPARSSLQFELLDWPAGWVTPRRWPALANLRIRRATTTWQALKSPEGLPAELLLSLQHSEQLLVIAPQAWMLDRLWPQLVSMAWNCLRYRPELGAPAAGFILGRLQGPGSFAVLGGPSAWRLTAFHHFERILILDPTHPYYSPEGSPYVDPRLALLLGAGIGTDPAAAETRVDLVEFGLSAWDGEARLGVELAGSFTETAGALPPAEVHDADPLPLRLRQPGIRRLIYFNRLGKRRGFHCIQCETAAACPACSSARLMSVAMPRPMYRCGDCGWQGVQLRCLQCGLMTFSASTPGLESVSLRPGDLVVTSETGTPALHPGASVLGTAALLTPLAGYWPQEVVYVVAEGRVGLYGDWPQCIDMALRLAALYDNPELRSVHVVSDRLRAELGDSLDARAIQERWRDEQSLREFGGLPPYGTLYELHLRSASLAALEDARSITGTHLSAHAATTLLRLGRPHPGPGGYLLAGYLVNPEAGQEQLMTLRWEVNRIGASLSIQAIHGPWG